jgi:hypothetical protein
MVCYARPASWLAAVAVVAFVILGRPVGHFLDTAAVAVALTVVIAGAAVATALVLAAFMSTRRRRAAAGGCVSCQFRCQHAMTASSRRSWLVTIVDRRAPALVPVAERPAAARGRPVPVFLPMPSVAPRWPDRPARRPVTSKPGPRERAGSAA